MYHKRILEERLKNSLGNHRITVLIGPRQSGKTTLIKHIFNEVTEPKLYLDLDILENQEIFSSYNEVVRYLEFNGYRADKMFYLFLDEFQALNDISRILKNLHDHHTKLKIFVTGSSSLEILEKFKESLAGRKEIFYLYPLTFQEFLSFKDETFAQKLESSSNSEIPLTIRRKLMSYLREALIYGLYPEVALTPDENEKKEIIRSIVDLFVKKDLISLLKMKNPQAALNILRYIAINIGGVINYSDISATQHIDLNTLKRYLLLLNETFILKTVKPFFRNKNKEIVKAPKIYFVDAGIRNYFLKNFSPPEQRPDIGFLAENFALSQFLKRADFLTEIKFWRDKNGREIDFVLQRENQIKAYEIKWKSRITIRDVANLEFFKKSYNEAKAFLVSPEKPNLGLGTIQEIDFFDL